MPMRGGEAPCAPVAASHPALLLPPPAPPSQSFHLVQKAPSTLLTSAGMALPLLFVLYARAAGMRAYHSE